MVIQMEQPGSCVNCGQAPGDSFAHCAICAADYCLACGAEHLCRPDCAVNGCRPGLCVKVVTHGVISPIWGVPEHLRQPLPSVIRQTDDAGEGPE